MDFIKQLEESKFTRNKSKIASLSYVDICHRFYLSLLIVEFLRQFVDTKSEMVEYAKNTESYNSFKHFKVGATDLHNFIYYIIGNEKALSSLDDPYVAKQ